MTGVFHELRARLMAWLVLRSALASLAALALLFLLAVIADAALDLPESIRVVAPWLLIAAAAVVAGKGVWEWRRQTEPVLARRFEGIDSTLGSRLTNAVDLARGGSGTAVGEYLRREAIEMGRNSAAKLSPVPLVAGSVRRAALLMAFGAFAWAGLIIGGMDLLQAVVPRFLDAHGDHPPFSRLKIAVNPGPVSVLYGGQAEIRATTSGRPADKLWLVTKTGATETRAIMFLAPDKSYFQTLANLREPAQYYVTDGAARSRRYPVNIQFTPRITDLEVTTTFPEYTAKPAHTGKLGEEAQALPEGTRVGFRVTSNRPLKSGAIELTPVLGGKPVAVKLEPQKEPTVVAGSFILVEAVAFELSIRDVAGLECSEPRRGRFNILPDQPPRIFVVEPGKDAVATPSFRVPVRVQATDDYGVSRVVWLRGLNQSTERPFQMTMTPKAGATSVECVDAFDLAALGVRPGDVIDYYFEAADNYPKGPNVVFSRAFRLQIISEEQYASILRQSAARKALFESYSKIDAWTRRLAERSRSAAAKAANSDPTAAADAAELAKQLAEYEQALKRLLKEPAMFDVDESFHATLAAELAQVSDLKSQLAKAVANGVPDPGAMKKISEQLGALAASENQMVGAPAAQIAAVAHLLAGADAFVKLAARQAEIARLLVRFDKPDALTQMEKMELQELAHQQQRVKEGLHDLLEQLPQLLADVPDEPDYAQLRADVNHFIAAVAEAKIEQELADATGALAVPEVSAGHALAQSAAEKMRALIGECNGMGKPGRQALQARFQPKLSKPGLGNSLDQILAAMGAGNGENGRDGYGLFNESVALYGPNAQVAGEQSGGSGDTGTGRSRAGAPIAGDARDPGLPAPGAPGRVRLQPDAKFPLRYRELVGEYFRVIAESGKEGK